MLCIFVFTYVLLLLYEAGKKGGKAYDSAKYIMHLAESNGPYIKKSKSDLKYSS